MLVPEFSVRRDGGLILTMDEPSGLSLLAEGSMAVGDGEVRDKLEERHFLGCRTHHTNGWQ